MSPPLHDPVAAAAFRRTGSRAVSNLRRVPWTWILYGGLLLLILSHAAEIRFRLPQTPLIDPDSWGYFGPGLTRLTGGTFPHLNGRNFVYPAFLYVVAWAFDDMQGISAVQHALGMLTGAVLAAAWNVLCALLILPVWAKVAARFSGLVLVAGFLFSRSPVLFENTVRPEGVFPLFLATSFLLNFGALAFSQRQGRSSWTWGCLAANFFVVAVAQSLKPSLGFGAAVANLPLLFFSCRPGVSWGFKAVCAGGMVGLCALTLWLPERLLAKGDPVATVFLPGTLLTIHADIIQRQISEDLGTGDLGPYSRPWLTEFNRRLSDELAAARRPEVRPWPSLGFSADELLYVHPVFSPSFRPSEADELAAFCLHYYRRAWAHQPEAMFTKVVTQLGLVYRFKPVDLSGKRRWRRLAKALRPVPLSNLANDYALSLACAQSPQWQERLRLWPPAGGYLSALNRLKTVDIRPREPLWTGYLNRICGFLHLPLLGLTLLTGIALALTSKPSAYPLVAGVFLVWTINFGMFLTVAVVHCLEFDRYVENQRVCTMFGDFAALLLLWQGVLCLPAPWRERTQTRRAAP